MSENGVPRGWAVARLGDFCVERVEQREPGEGTVPYIDIGSIDRATKTIGELEYVTGENAPTRARQWVRQGDVLVSMTRPNLNAVALVTPALDGAVASTGFDVLRPLGVLPELVLNRVRSQDFVVDVCDGLQGVVYPAIRPHDVRQHELPVPPLPEQRRIVDAIESYFSRLDDAVVTLERAQRNLRRYRASVLKAAVEGRLVPTEAELARAEGRDYEPATVLLERILAERLRLWETSGPRGKFVEAVAPETTRLPELPEGWCWASLPQLGELNRGKSKHRPRNDHRLLGGRYPFIQTGDVKKADGFIEGYEATYSEFGLAQSRLWPAGTVCITIAANIAETGILKFDACFPDSVVGFLPSDDLLTRYVEFFIRTARQRLDQYAPGTAQKNINLEVLSRVAVPLPPRVEQGRIVAEVDRHFSVATHCMNVAAQAVVRCQRVRQAILKWAFEGRLASQDPNDESASVLLERIKAEREAAQSTTKKTTVRANGRTRATA